MIRTSHARLRLGALALAPTAILAALAMNCLASPIVALLTVLGLYWSGCWLLICWADDSTSLRDLYAQPVSRSPRVLAMTWLPPILVASVLLGSGLPPIPPVALVAVLGIALVNGVTEEALWRGKFANAFPDRIAFGYAYPTAIYVLWHIALLCVSGIEYEGGAIGMLGGAALMGGLWGYAHWIGRDLRSVTLAHIATNVCAFSMLVEANWRHT